MWGLTAYGINDSGQIVGDAAKSSRAVHAFLYCNGTMQDLGTLGGTNSEAAGINNSAQVVAVLRHNPTQFQRVRRIPLQ